MPIDDPPADRRPDPSESTGPDLPATETDADSATVRDAPTAGAATAEASDPTSTDGSDDDGPAVPSVPTGRDAQTDEARTQHMVGRSARLTPVKATPVKAAPIRTTPIKATPVVATPIKPFPVKATQTGATPVWLGHGQVPQTRSPSGRGRKPDASTVTSPASEPAAEATAAIEAPLVPEGPTLANAPVDVGSPTSGPAAATFAPGAASVGWHPPLVDPPAAAAVSPAPLGFIAPGNMFAPPRHAAAQPGRRRALLVTTSALAVLFLLVGAGFAFAFVNRNNAYHKQVTTVNKREATIASNVSQINDLRSKLAAAQAQSQQLQSQIADSATQLTELQQEKTVLGQCITSINNFFTVVGENGTSAEQSTAQTTMETDCNAAQKYLN